MSADSSVPAYSPCFVKFWSIFSAVLGFALFLIFCYGDTLLGVGNVVWDLIRWVFSPLI